MKIVILNTFAYTLIFLRGDEMDKKLEALQERVSKLFEGATEKAQIDTLASISKDIEEIDNEKSALLSKNAELMTAYKEAILHASFKEPGEPIEPDKPKTLEDMINDVISQRK